MKINLKKKVMLALLAGGMLCANSAFADDYDPLEWYGLNDGSAKYTVTKPGYSSGATLTLDDSNYAAQSVVASAYGLRLFYGGYSETGEAKDNIVNITKLDNNPSVHYAYICGGYGAAANNNKVIVGVAGDPDAIVGTNLYRVYGGYATEKEANDNLVICYGKFDELRGASSFTEASRNTVNIENGIPIVNGNLSAAYINNSGTSGAAADDIQIKGNDNVLNIRKFANTSNLTNINVADIFVFTEGGNGNLNVQANHNILNYYDDTPISRYIRAGNVKAVDNSTASGIVYAESNNNEVNIYNITQTGGGLIAGNIFIDIGDFGSCGEAHAVAKQNKVNIYGDVNISNSELDGASLDLEIWPEYDCGTGTVEGTDNEVNVIKGNFDDTEIYGAYGYADSGTGYNGDPCDGGTLTVTLDNNRVNISSGTFTDVTVYGAYGETGSWPEDGYATGDITTDLENNKVNFTDGNFKSGEIYGGYVYADYGYDTAGGEYNITIKNNTVDIKNGTFGSSGDVGIYGGYVSLEFDNVPGTESDTNVLVDNNTINIENGSFGTSTNNATIYGGYVEILYDDSDGTVKSVISNNTINIKSGTFNSGTIYGGYTSHGDVNGNQININGGSFGDGLKLYGGYTDSGTSTGNTLNLKTVIAGTAAEVKYFQNMNFTVPAGVSSDAVMLKSTAAVALSGVNVTVDLNGLSLTGNDYITLIQNVADAGFSETDHLKILDVAGTYCLVYTNGTPTAKADYTVKQGSTVKSEGTDASHEYANTIIKGRDTTDGGMTSGYTITVRRGTYGSVTSGDPSRIYAVKSDSVDVCNNEIHIFDGKFFFNHYPDADNSIITGIVDTTGGGCDVYNNKVTIDGGEFFFNAGIEETTVQPAIAAGMADGATESDAHKVYGNIVEINDGYFKNTGTIVAGVARIGGTAHSDSVVGGTSLANGNKLIVNNMKFMGQYSLEGGVGIADNPLPVNYNTVEIKNVVFESGSILQVVGGHGIGRTGASVSHNLVDVQGISSSTAQLLVSAAQAVGNSLPTSNDAINITVEGNKLNVANVDALYLAVIGAVGSSNSVQDSGVAAPNVTMNIKNNEILVSKVNITNVAQIFGSMAGSTQISSDTYTGDFNHTISDNKLKITDSTFAVLMATSGGEMVNPPEGGGTPGTMNISVSNNIFEMENCTVGSGGNQIMGAATMNGGANNNKLFITNSTIGDISTVAGAQAMGGDAHHNYVKISNSTFLGESYGSQIFGGYTEGGYDVHDNELVIESGNYNMSCFIGGSSEISGKAYNNTVSILNDADTDCTVEEVQGGKSNDEATGNIVNIGQEGGKTTFSNMVFTTLYGGSGSISSGNKLNLHTRITASEVGYFQEMNFTLPKDVAADDTIISGVTSLSVDGAGGEATVNVYAAKGVKLNKDDVITLVDSDDTSDTFVGGDILGGAAAFYSEADAGEDLNGDGDEKDLVITLLKDYSNSGSEDQQKAPVEGIAAAMQTVNMSADLASGEGMASLVAETAEGFTNTFSAITAGQSKYKTGSHIDVDGWGFLVGAGTTKNWTNGQKTTYGLFFEYGKGDFDTYNGNVHGDGNSKNQGVGIMVRHKLTNNTYYEGNIRYGKQSTEWGESEIGSYDTDSKYYGIMVGMGHIFPAGKNEIDVYGRYTFGHVGACDATVGDSHYNFESVKSHRVRLGAKYNFVQEKSNAKPFIGLAWEHEFKGESKASISGVGEAPAPSMKGHTGIFELGCDWDVSKKWTVGLGANAYMGKRKGWDGMARVFYNF